MVEETKSSVIDWEVVARQKALALEDLTKKFEELNIKYVDLIGQLSVQSQQIQSKSTLVLPPIGSTVNYVNHGGYIEKAEVTGHGKNGVHLLIQGGHVNDIYTRKDVPPGTLSDKLTFHEPDTSETSTS